MQAFQAESETLTVDSILLGLRQEDSALALRGMKLEQWRDYSRDAFVLQLSVRLAANTIWKEQESVEVPFSWWQAFKERWFPPILRRWFPVAYRQIVTETRFIHACPHVGIDEPRTHFAWLMPPKAMLVEDGKLPRE